MNYNSINLLCLKFGEIYQPFIAPGFCHSPEAYTLPGRKDFIRFFCSWSFVFYVRGSDPFGISLVLGGMGPTVQLPCGCPLV